MEEVDESRPRLGGRTNGSTNLRDGHKIRHTLKVTSREIGITSRLNSYQSLVDLCTELLLTVPILGQLPKSKGQLEDS